MDKLIDEELLNSSVSINLTWREALAILNFLSDTELDFWKQVKKKIREGMDNS
jgi:hypothetical protein